MAGRSEWEAVAIGSHPGRRVASPPSGKPRVPPSERKRSMTGPVPPTYPAPPWTTTSLRASRSSEARAVPSSSERRNRGYTLYDARSGAPVARLRPAKPDGHFEVLYWSLWKERWSPTGPFGSTILALDDALACIAAEDIFWAST